MSLVQIRGARGNHGNGFEAAGHYRASVFRNGKHRIKPSGSVIPDATITLINEGTGAKTAKTSNGRGEFVFDFLPGGSYTLTIEAKGFKRYENRGLEFAATQNVRQTFPMQLGTVAETVLVEATTPLVNTASSEQRETRSELELTQLPVARRTIRRCCRSAPAFPIPAATATAFG